MPRPIRILSEPRTRRTERDGDAPGEDARSGAGAETDRPAGLTVLAGDALAAARQHFAVRRASDDVEDDSEEEKAQQRAEERSKAEMKAALRKVSSHLFRHPDDALRYLELLDAEPDAEVAVATVEPLRYARSDELAAVLAERARTDADPLRRRVSILGLAGNGGKAALDAVLHVAGSDQVDEVRADAVQVLGVALADKRHDAERASMLEVIGKNLSHAHEETRVQAVMALLAIPADPDLEKKLQEIAASDPSRRVSATATHVLKRWTTRSR